MRILIKSLVLGTMLATLLGVTSANAEVVKKVTVKHHQPDVHRVIVIHPNYHVYQHRHHHRHHHGDWKYHHRHHHGDWKHHHRHHNEKWRHHRKHHR